jgi:hypothetical protein
VRHSALNPAGAARARLRLIRPDADALVATGARRYERGVYESWAPTGELTDHHIADIPYAL